MMGTVQDSTGAALPDADLKLVNSQTGTENVSRTSGDGRFILPGVLPGAYSLQIERSGFATTQLSGIVLNVGDTKNLLIRLKIGATTESVNVDASGLTLNTTDGSVSTVVDRRFVSIDSPERAEFSGSDFDDAGNRYPESSGRRSAIRSRKAISASTANGPMSTRSMLTAFRQTPILAWQRTDLRLRVPGPLQAQLR